MSSMGTLVKELRGKTGAGILDCQNALKETDSDIEKAIDLLRQRGLAAAQKKAGRETKEGVVSSYIHAGSKIGVLVEVNCETDFVARNEEFQELVKDVALQIAAANPSYVKREQVPSEQVEREKAIYLAQAKELGKPEAAIDKIVQGKLEKFYQENCLLEQSFIKDPNVSITEILTQKIAKLGENISIARFTRYQLGQE
ncbi:MAG: translation elongation factor Ts [Nitrospira sp.]|nr:translation elongation factor Ts [Nitrospira sp.]MYA29207.1 translation elongation factor Ts [Nitrospira sp. SB0666_bin_27]MYC27339.1 translation elongation factor Ts [Nitrospira sp. SB0662_bin_26]MYF23778.1 translation elongation factor Ts [Nitrospira sp. SB0678_bin_10]MCY3954982.1 translation elongation factor Ts [Nitrospira sp.]